MSEEESIILGFLQGYPESAFGRKEIARKAGSRAMYEENPRWSDAPLNALVERKLIEIKESGHYQVKQSR